MCVYMIHSQVFTKEIRRFYDDTFWNKNICFSIKNRDCYSLVPSLWQIY